ncbi:hypothetical protein AB0O51_27655 [Streptomyces sp. NPDC090301]|uniref:hypothetical protein n=1 Tax=Streptomyces sp. NPDC090301 TaxID=3154975 RepID=UPI00343A47DF
MVADTLPEVDEVLAQALTAQGEPGARALGLLQDAHQILSADVLRRPTEVAESCLRGAADALLSLPGVPAPPIGLKTAAASLLAAVEAADTIPASVTDVPAGDRASTGRPADAAWDRVRAAAGVLRGQLVRPGGYHRGRAAGIAERLMGVKLGAAQEEALGVWGSVYGKTSGTLHGVAAEAGRTAGLYTEVLAAARELLVPLPGRAPRVLELTALDQPGPDQARELARWADPRATAFFFRSRPAAAWLPVLQEHAPHLLHPDVPAGGVWPAAVFFEHLADAAPVVAGAWLAEHAEDVAAAGRPALDAVLRLAGRSTSLVPPALVRGALVRQAADRPAREAATPQQGWTLRLATEWACAVPRPDRDRDWILTVELLLKATVDAEHTAARNRRTAPAEYARAAAARPDLPSTGLGWVLLDDPEDWEQAALAQSARMPDHLVGRLLKELVATGHPAGPHAGAHQQARMIRAVLASQLARDLEQTTPAARRIVFHEDLDQIRIGAPAAFGGPRLARAVLDLAAADAEAGESLADRTAPWKKIATADAWLYDRLQAAHLAARPPALDSPAAAPEPDPALQFEWEARAHALVPRLLAGRPAPEPARLVDIVWRTCPPTPALQEAARAALGTPPNPRAIDEILPAGADRVDGTVEPLASWLRVWDWSPVLPADLLADFQPMLAALRRLAPEGPADPRAAIQPQPVTAPRNIDGTDIAELAAAHGPLVAAGALAGAQDPGADVCAGILHRLVATDPAAWTTDVPALLAALELPILRAFYLTAVQAAAHLPGALPDPNLSHAIAGALQLHRYTSSADPADPRAELLLRCADEALFGLLAQAWERPATAAAADDPLPGALAHLHTQAGALTRPATRAATDPSENTPAADPTASRLLRPDPPVRALECLLHYAVARARTDGTMPTDVLDLLTAVLTASAGQPAVAVAIGLHLPALYHYAPHFTEAHRAALTALNGRPTPAAAWLRTGPADPSLLTTLDRAALLSSPRSGAGGPVEHLAHALTADPHALGDPASVLAEIAASPGGPEAVSWLLQVMASCLLPQWAPIVAGRLKFTSPEVPPATGPELAAVATVWRAALAADLPLGALAGVGYFADLALDDAVWLPLARASAGHTPPDNPGTAAERAASHPASRDALLLAADLVTRPADVWGQQTVLPHARALLQAATAVIDHPHTEAVLQLREALINAGEVDLARTHPTIT